MDPQYLDVGLHDNIPAERYHDDPCEAPSLSSGIARTILSQSLFHAYHEHTRLGGVKSEATPAMVMGNLVHAMLAGESDSYEIGNFDDFKTKDARAWRDGVAAAKKLPVLEKHVDNARPIVKATREKAAMGLTTDPFSVGKPEVTAVWREDDAWCRARFDRLILDEGGYADIWDWKTTTSVAVDDLARKIIDEGYHIQAAFYMRGLRKLLPRFAGRISFVFVFVESSAPYSARRVTLSNSFLTIGDGQVHKAIEAWKQATKTNVWSDGATETANLEAPTWFTAKHLELVS
jgi:hypothetical protein